MATIDYLHDGIEHDYEASTYTLVAYEQEFCNSYDPAVTGDLIRDVFGRVEKQKVADNFDENGDSKVVWDFTIDNWNASLRAFWAMLKTSYEVKKAQGIKVPDEQAVPSFVRWCLQTSGSEGAIDMQEISRAVWDEAQRGLFRSGLAEAEPEQGE